LTDQESASHGDAHQGVHVQLAAPQCGQSLAISGESGEGNGSRCQRHAQPLEQQGIGCKEIQRLGSDGQCQGDQGLTDLAET